jgi:hypothetical protein
MAIDQHRRKRNIALLVVLLGLVGLFYLITVVKIAGGYW